MQSELPTDSAHAWRPTSRVSTARDASPHQRLGASPPPTQRPGVRGHPRPLRHRAGRRTRRGDPGRRRRAQRGDDGRRRRRRRARTRRLPAASRSSTRRSRLTSDVAITPPIELWRPKITAGLPDHARPRPGDLAASAAAGEVAAGRGLAARLPRRPSTPPASPRCTARSWSSRRPSRARTSSGSTTSAALRTSRSRRSSTSRCSSASSSACTRSGRCFGPSRTTRSATWPSTSRSTSSSASSETTSR